MEEEAALEPLSRLTALTRLDLTSRAELPSCLTALQGLKVGLGPGAAFLAAGGPCPAPGVSESDCPASLC